MHSLLLFLLVAAIGVASSPTSLLLPKRQSIAPFSSFGKHGVYYPPSTYPFWRAGYARTTQAADGSLLMTWENYPSNEPDWFPVIRSVDGGVTWTNVSRVVDTQNGWGMRFQPNLYVLPDAIGTFAAGSILATGVSTAVDQSTNTPYGPIWIDAYISTDNGASWTFLSHIIYGEGPCTIKNGDKAIWEPFTLLLDGKLVIYYSDQRDPAHGQKISFATSTDLLQWSESQDVVAYSTYEDRPGMPTLAYSPVSSKWMLTYEYCGSGGCKVHYRLSSNPTDWTNAEDHQLIDEAGDQPTSSPYVTYFKAPGASQGSFIVSDAYSQAVFVNDDSASASTWKAKDVGQYAGYSRCLTLFDAPNGTTLMHYATAGYYGCSGSCYNFVANGVGPVPS